MGTMTINKIRVTFTDEEENVLSVIRKAGFEMPTLCYRPELLIHGSCRLCVVEDKHGRTFASCSEKPRDGMEIYTNTPRLMRYRKMILELLLASHQRDCTVCIKSGECLLQATARRMGVNQIRYETQQTNYPLDMSSPAIVLNPNKCILCGNCVRMCGDVQGIGAVDFVDQGPNYRVATVGGSKLADTDCVGCGQCRTFCPTGAITINTNINAIREAIADPNVKVVAQIAPAVRVAVGHVFGFPNGVNVMGRIVNAMHRLGFDEVYDTAFGADFTVMEESKELLERLESGENLPLVTSCCPAWVLDCEKRYPELASHLSTCRSPMQMLGAVIREYYKNPKNNEGKRVLSVAVMPCTAKKGEILRPESMTDGVQDIDYVLTTNELCTMIKKDGILFDRLEVEAVDMPFGISSGAGMIFGNSGGVTEAVLRRLNDGHERARMEQIRQSGVRGEEGIKEIVFHYHGKELRAAIVSGLANAAKLLKDIESGKVTYHFVEVMACRCGCVMGGGQPLPAGDEERASRPKGLYEVDLTRQIKKSDENPLVLSLYDGLIRGKEHKLLHRNMAGRNNIGQKEEKMTK